MIENNKEPRRIPGDWKIIRSESGPELPIFKVRLHSMENPRNNQVFKRLVLETYDWVNVVALTPDEKIIVVRQFRPGTNKVTTEIPGGVVDAGEKSNQAAARELIEETGYASSSWSYLGNVEVNPAIQNNHCHFWLAKNAVFQQAPNLEPGEDIQVVLFNIQQLGEEIRSGRLAHSLALSAISRVFDIRNFI